MKTGVLVDAGPLVALIDRRDEYHVWATEQSKIITSPLRTCEAALAEAMHLLESRTHNVQALWQMLERGFLNVDFSLREQMQTVLRLMKNYTDVPMSLADACLVRMCELNRSATLFTTDGDFRIYRKNGRETLSLIIPPLG